MAQLEFRQDWKQLWQSFAKIDGMAVRTEDKIHDQPTP
jgi:hypothetical protein